MLNGSGSWLLSSSGGGRLGEGYHGVGFDFVVPLALVFGGINVERDVVLALDLDIELADAVFSKDFEDHVTGVLTGDFKDVLLGHPCVAGLLGNARTGGEDCDDCSYKFHNEDVYFSRLGDFDGCYVP